MKVFMITWVVFCFLVIVGLFIAYATDNFPGVPSPQSRSEDPDPDLSRMPMNLHKSGRVGLETEAECSPCEENLKRLKKAMEQQAARERESKASVGTGSDAP